MSRSPVQIEEEGPPRQPSPSPRPRFARTENRQQGRRRRWTPWFVGIGLLSLVGSLAVAFLSVNPLTRASAPAAGSGTTSRSDRRAVAVAYVDVEGGIRSLFPAQPGRVIATPVPEGKEVEKGTVLLEIDEQLARNRLAEAKLDLGASRERLEQAGKLVDQHASKIAMQQAALEAANKKLEAAQAQSRKAERWFRERLGGTAEDVEAAGKLVEEARAGVKAEESRLELIRSVDPKAAVRLAQIELDSKTEQVDKATLGLRECKLVAPCKGMILRRLVNVGEMLGASPVRPAIEFCPSNDRIVRAEVEQEFAGKLFIGQKALMSDDVTGNGEWEGEVVRVSDWFTQRRAVLLEPMQFNDMRTLEVIIKLKADPKNPLRINQRVRVRLAGEK